MMMNKEEFVKCMDDIKEMHDFQDNVQSMFRDFGRKTKDDFVELSFPTLENTLVRTLETIFSDTESQNISWWIYECEMGNVSEDLLTITYPDDTQRIIRTSGDLYDFLISEAAD